MAAAVELEDMEDMLGEPEDLDGLVEGKEDERSGHPPRDTEEDEAAAGEKASEEKAKRKVPVRNPRPKLDPARLCGPLGLRALIPLQEEVASNLRAAHDMPSILAAILRPLDRWAHRLSPHLSAMDTYKRIEQLAGNKMVQTHINKLRMDVNVTNDDFPVEPTSDHSDQEAEGKADESSRFDDLFGDITPRAYPQSIWALTDEEEWRMQEEEERRKADSEQTEKTSGTSQPEAAKRQPLSEEQMERIRRNKAEAEERLRKRLLLSQDQENIPGPSSQILPSSALDQEEDSRRTTPMEQENQVMKQKRRIASLPSEDEENSTEHHNLPPEEQDSDNKEDTFDQLFSKGKPKDDEQDVFPKKKKRVASLPVEEEEDELLEHHNLSSQEMGNTIREETFTPLFLSKKSEEEDKNIFVKKKNRVATLPLEEEDSLEHHNLSSEEMHCDTGSTFDQPFPNDDSEEEEQNFLPKKKRRIGSLPVEEDEDSR